VAVAAGAGLAVAGVGATVYYWPFLKYVVGTFLYARLPRDRILDHRGRGMVYDMVRAEPGVSTHRLAESVDFGWSTLMYHLRVLERTEKIVSVRDGRYKRFFDRESGKFANGRKFVVAVLKNEATYAIAQHILARPGITQKELSGLLDLAPSSIHWHVERLASADLLEKRRDGHNIRYYPGPAWSEVSPQDLQASTVSAADAAALLDNPFAPPLGASAATGLTGAAAAANRSGPVPPPAGPDGLLR
jgi:DNA-binding transcriptional ArsR family regulator